MGAWEYLKGVMTDVRAALDAEPGLRARGTAVAGPCWDTDSDDPVADADMLVWRSYAVPLLALGAKRPISGDVISELLDYAFKGHDERVRGAAWLIVCDAWEHSGAIAVRGDFVCAIMRRIADDEIKDHEEVGGKWLRLLCRLVRLARSAAKIRPRRNQPAWWLELTARGARLGQGGDSHHDWVVQYRQSMERVRELSEMARNQDRTPSAVERAMELAETDPILHVRSEAVFALGIVFSRSREPRVLKFLARVIQNVREQRSIRASAYTSLLCVDGRVEERLKIKPGEDEYVTMSLIDWSYVSACAALDDDGRSNGSEG